MLFQTEKLFHKEERQFFIRRLLRRIFLDDWLIKIVALLITFSLWFGVTGLRAPTTVRLTNIPLTLRFSNEIEAVNSPTQEVDIVITGDKRKISQINKNDLIISVDLTDVKAGERIIQLTPETVNYDLPTGVKLEEIQPSKIPVKLEKVEVSEIPVRVETEGTPPEGFEIYDTVVSPPKVRVRGPESYVNSLDSISTERINVENKYQDFTVQQIELNIVNPKVTLIDTVVDVTVKIGEKRIERLFKIPVKIGNESRTATVVLYGARSVLENINPESLQTEGVTTDTGENSLRLILPPEIQNKVEIRKFDVN